MRAERPLLNATKDGHKSVKKQSGKETKMDSLFDSQGSTYHIQIVVNGGLEYDAEMTVAQINSLLETAEELERNTAYYIF